MKADIDIAQDAVVQPIEQVAALLGLGRDDLHPYGRYMAKVPLDVLERLDGRPDGKLVLVTAITATKAGEGKTVTSIGLMQALGRQGVKVMGALREPSMGPVFGIKGGATGGGMSQIYPMWDIDLHFTGDIHAVTSAHNLLSAMVENHLAKGNRLRTRPRPGWCGARLLTPTSRELRNIVVGRGGRAVGGVAPRERVRHHRGLGDQRHSSLWPVPSPTSGRGWRRWWWRTTWTDSRSAPGSSDASVRWSCCSRTR